MMKSGKYSLANCEANREETFTTSDELGECDEVERGGKKEQEVVSTESSESGACKSGVRQTRAPGSVDSIEDISAERIRTLVRNEEKRLEKNRIKARIARRRKKMKVSDRDRKIQEMTEENETLTDENEELREKLEELIKECERLEDENSRKSVKGDLGKTVSKGCEKSEDCKEGKVMSSEKPLSASRRPQPENVAGPSVADDGTRPGVVPNHLNPGGLSVPFNPSTLTPGMREAYVDPASGRLFVPMSIPESQASEAQRRERFLFGGALEPSQMFFQNHIRDGRSVVAPGNQQSLFSSHLAAFQHGAHLSAPQAGGCFLANYQNPAQPK